MIRCLAVAVMCVLLCGAGDPDAQPAPQDAELAMLRASVRRMRDQIVAKDAEIAQLKSSEKASTVVIAPKYLSRTAAEIVDGAGLKLTRNVDRDGTESLEGEGDHLSLRISGQESHPTFMFLSFGVPAEDEKAAIGSIVSSSLLVTHAVPEFKGWLDFFKAVAPLVRDGKVTSVSASVGHNRIEIWFLPAFQSYVVTIEAK